jgi:hypothetical protein
MISIHGKSFVGLIATHVAHHKKWKKRRLDFRLGYLMLPIS